MEHLDHPSPHFNDAKMARFLLLRAFIIALGGMGDNCSILYCNLGQNRWNIWTSPPPISMMPKWRVSCSFVPSSLLWGGWGIIVPFYTVQDCRRYDLGTTVSQRASSRIKKVFTDRFGTPIWLPYHGCQQVSDVM